MAAVLAASALLLGALAERLRRLGLSTELFLAGVLTLSMVAQLALLLGLPVPSALLFAFIASGGASNVLSFAILARYFPREVGRANAALGVLNMGAAFCLQSLSGLIIAQWPADGGHYPAMAHHAAMAAGLALQLIALGFFLPPGRRVKPAPMAHAVSKALRFSEPPQPPMIQPVYSSWIHQAEIARKQRATWRLAAAASAALCLGLAATLSLTIARPAIALHVIELPAPAGQLTRPAERSTG
jgi:MFS family permease